MRKNWFNRLLLSYLPVFFVISLSLLLITYLTLNEMSKRSAIRANELLSQSIMQLIDNTLLDLDTLMQQQLMHNDKIKLFFQTVAPADRQQADYEAAAALNDLMSKNPMIGSVYLFRTEDQVVLTPATRTTVEKFGDKYFIGKYVKSLRPFRWLDKREYQEHEENPPRQVVSLIKFGKISDGSLMVVNVNTDSLSGIIRGMSESNLNFVDLIDTQGKVLATKEFTQTSDGLKVQDTDPSKGPELSYARSSYTGWTIRSGIYSGNILEWVSSLFYVWIVVGFLVILAGIVWLVFVTRRNYKPIQVMMRRISDYAGPSMKHSELKDRVDELQYIGITLDDLMDKSHTLQEQNKENLAYRKKQLFLNIMEGVSLDQNWEQELKELGFDEHHGCFIVVLTEIDGIHSFCSRYNHRDQHLLKHIVRSVTAELASTRQTRVWSEWVHDNRLGALYFFEEPGIAEEEMMPLAEKLRHWVQNLLAFTVTIGVGPLVLQPEQISASYQASLQALEYKASFGNNRLISLADLSSRAKGEVYKHLQETRQLSQSYRSGDADWEDQFNDLYRSLQSRLYTREDLISLHNHLLYTLTKEVAALPAELQQRWKDEADGQLKLILEQAETMEELHDGFYRVLLQAYTEMQEYRERNNNHQLIQSVKQYISHNYSNPDLSLMHLSNEFGLGSSYLSRLFKEAFGVKFIDYVVQVRIEKATELLQQTEETIQDIAATVGYPRSLTFIRAFKKHMGITPGNYRKSYWEAAP
ncbi:hypothetical protein J2TS4_18530 [Paenibacillus sp. J2TS4]|nr:hypothetical protein J2TS4_18530 [Paenibacillus sp. J2TS4]